MITQFVELDEQLGSKGRYFNPFGPPMFHFKLNQQVFNLVYDCVRDFQKHDEFKTGHIIQGTNAAENEHNSIVNGEIFGIPPKWQFENHNGILANCVKEVTYQYACLCARASKDDIALREYNRIDEKVEEDIHAFVPEIETIWYVSLKDGDFHIIHDHASNSTFSGAIYLQTPEAPYPQGKINWIVSGNGGGMYNNVFGIVPVAGDVFIWPSWVSHTVYPFRGDGERLMISFNSRVKVKNGVLPTMDDINDK